MRRYATKLLLHDFFFIKPVKIWARQSVDLCMSNFIKPR